MAERLGTTPGWHRIAQRLYKNPWRNAANAVRLKQ